MLFPEYAREFARRYPWVRYYTPVSDIFHCASYSALRGWWNECESSDAAFVRALRNLCLAHESAVEAIEKWRFKPGTKDGVPVTVKADVEVNFRLM